MQRILTPINEKFLDEKDILHINVLEGTEITLEKLKIDHEMGLKLTGNRKVLALVDTRASFVITPEAREFMRSDVINQYRIATAVVTDNSVSRIIVNLFMKLNTPSTPFKMFNCPEKAEQWLLETKEKTQLQ